MIAALAAAQAPDAVCPADRSCVRTNAAGLFALAEELLRNGQPAAATKVLEALQQDRRSEVRLEARFRLGRMFEARGDLAAAAAQYQAILDESPRLGSVRLALARVLAAEGAGRRAREEVRRARSVGLPIEVAQAVDRFETVLRSRQQLGASIEIGVAPDSNINHATSSSTVDIAGLPFDLTPDARRRAGLGGYATGQAYWRPQVTHDINMLTIVSGTGTLFGASRFNDISSAIGVGPELVGTRFRLQATGKVGWRWFGGKRYSRSYGGGVSAILAVGSAGRVQLAVDAVQADYVALAAQSGPQITGSVSYERRLTRRLSARITLRGERDEAAAAAFDTRTYGAGLLVSREIGHAVAYVTAGYYATDGAGPFSLPPLTRKDRLFQAEGGVTLPPIFRSQLSPVVRVRYADNHSPIFFYGFSEYRAEIGVSHDF